VIEKVAQNKGAGEMKAGGAELLLIVEVIEPGTGQTKPTTPKIERAFSLDFGCGGGWFRVAAARGSPPPLVIVTGFETRVGLRVGYAGYGSGVDEKKVSPGFHRN